jgi:two-component system alkaline phosphatase synthesis response regulator PhoP/two-component system response regulator RpaA
MLSPNGHVLLDCEHSRLLFADGRSLPLTRTELALVVCLFEHDGAFVSVDELLQIVWGYSLDMGGPEVVRSHVSNVRRKLRSIGEDPQLLRTQPYRGYAIEKGACAM